MPRAGVPWRLHDLSGLEREEQERKLAALRDADRAERFDLVRPPLMRFALIRLSAERHRLLISNHHLLMDGWSAPVLVGEVLAAYAERGSTASLPRVTPYRDYLSFIAGAGPCGVAASLARGAVGPGGGHAARAAVVADAGHGGPGAGGPGARPAAHPVAGPAGARACADAEHDRADRVRRAAGAADRARRRGVRRDGCGAAGGAFRRRADGGAVHQHAAAADAACGRSFRSWSCSSGRKARSRR